MPSPNSALIRTAEVQIVGSITVVLKHYSVDNDAVRINAMEIIPRAGWPVLIFGQFAVEGVRPVVRSASDL